MCCYRHESVERKVRKAAKRGWFVGYKVLMRDLGISFYSNHQYHPGKMTAEVIIYNESSPSGLHIYTRLKDARADWASFETIVRVRCPIKEMVVAGSASMDEPEDFQQAVFRRIHISKRDWLAAGLPLAGGER